jgi:formylglycine-generating enzyme required for sulfatase activity
MPDVFISYSRRDLEFVHQLVAALKMSGKDPWFDQLKEPLSGIAAGVPWWQEIQYGIDNVDNFLFVISPNSIRSPYCHAEINYAREHGKRLIPVLYCSWIGEGETRKAIDAAIEAIAEDEEIPDSVTSNILNLKKLVRENWLVISEIQYVVFASFIAFEQSIEQLIQALDLDLAWVRMHSQLVQAAKLWEANDFDVDYLWGSNRLKSVYEMIERRKPELDTLVSAFIRPEHERLLTELEDMNTSHQRRSVIGERLAAIGDPRPGIGLRKDGFPDIVWCTVPGGKIKLKDKDGKDIGTFRVAPFYIAKYPITYVQFNAFLEDKVSGYRYSGWWRGLRKQMIAEQGYKYDNHPRDQVDWNQAVAFCRWLTAKLPRDAWPSGEIPVGTDWVIRLPTEWEWQQAATGGRKHNLYPWGEEADIRRTNTRESGIRRTMAVGMYPAGASPVGALDMSGNVWEWCLNEYKNPWNVNVTNKNSWIFRALRGGYFTSTADAASAIYRYGVAHHDRFTAFSGFRVALGTVPPGSGLLLQAERGDKSQPDRSDVSSPSAGLLERVKRALRGI